MKKIYLTFSLISFVYLFLLIVLFHQVNEIAKVEQQITTVVQRKTPPQFLGTCLPHDDSPCVYYLGNYIYLDSTDKGKNIQTIYSVADPIPVFAESEECNSTSTK